MQQDRRADAVEQQLPQLQPPCPPCVVGIVLMRVGYTGWCGMERRDSVWSCERLLSEHQVERGSDDRGAYTDVSFADVMISSWTFCFRVRDDGSVSVFVESIAQELASFSIFLALSGRPGVARSRRGALNADVAILDRRGR